MSHWKLILAYDGTPFHGWQIQPALPTVQGLLSGAIFRVIGERVLPQGSGRTDSGVHALGQVASFTLAAPSTAAFPPAFASSPPKSFRRNSTPATAQHARPTSTVSSPCARSSLRPVLASSPR